MSEQRRPREGFPTPAWVTAVVAAYLRDEGVERVWEPGGQAQTFQAMAALGLSVIDDTSDFLERASPPEWSVDAVVMGQPPGDDRKSELAVKWVHHALKLNVRHVAMLHRADFDSAKTRKSLFADCPAFAGKITLLDRIRWYDGGNAPGDSHAWYLWDKQHCGLPNIAYAERWE